MKTDENFGIFLQEISDIFCFHFHAQICWENSHKTMKKVAEYNLHYQIDWNSNCNRKSICGHQESVGTWEKKKKLKFENLHVYVNIPSLKQKMTLFTMLLILSRHTMNNTSSKSSISTVEPSCQSMFCLFYVAHDTAKHTHILHLYWKVTFQFDLFCIILLWVTKFYIISQKY